MRTVLVIATTASLLLLCAGCGTTGPSFETDFPFFYLQDVDCTSTPVQCTFMDDTGDGLACSGSSLYFLDRDQGYVLAVVDLGYPLSGCAASSEGGYAAAVSGPLLFYVSNDTYVEHDPVLLSASASFILTKPGGTLMYVVCEDGSVSTVSTVGSWYEVSNDTTAVGSPCAAAIDRDGTALFIADDNDDTVKMIDPSSLALLAEQQVAGGVNDLCTSPAGGVFAAPAEAYEAWHLDRSTGLHDFSVALPGLPQCLAVTPDAEYLYAGCTGQGIVVVDMAGGIEAQTVSYGLPSDMEVAGDGQRALVCSPELYKLIMLSM